MQNFLSHVICPITHAVPKDPVLASDGWIYSRNALQCWFETSTQSPMTREEMSMDDCKEAFGITQLYTSIRSCYLSSGCPTLPRNRSMYIDKGKTLALMRNLVANHALQQNGFIFGSGAYMKLLHSKLIVKFYACCRRNDVEPDLVYHDLTFHPESWDARHHIVNDLDIFFGDDRQVFSFAQSLQKRYAYKGLRVVAYREGKTIWPSNKGLGGGAPPYCNTAFVVCNELRRYRVSIAAGMCDSIHLALDVVSKRDGVHMPSMHMGWYPNILKTICKDRQKYFLRMFPKLCLEHSIIVLNSLQQMHERKETLTSVVHNGLKNIHDHPLCTDDAVRNDAGLFCAHLWKELKQGQHILNISSKWHPAEAGNQDMIAFTLFEGNRRTEHTHHMTLDDIQHLISNTSVMLLKNGMIMHKCEGIEYVIHYLLDPDFDILSTDYPELQLLNAGVC